jgi:hypothetical protein
MRTPEAVEPAKNPTDLLREQVTASQEIHTSLSTIEENQVGILESLTGSGPITGSFMMKRSRSPLAIMICPSDR